MSDTNATGALILTDEQDPEFTAGEGENTRLGDALLAEMEKRHGSDEDASGDNPVASESGEEETPPAPPSTEEGEPGAVDADLEMILGEQQENEEAPEPTVQTEEPTPEPEAFDIARYLRVRLGREPTVEELEALLAGGYEQQPEPEYEQQPVPTVDTPSIVDNMKQAMIAKYGPEGGDLAEALGSALVDTVVNPLQERVNAAEAALQQQQQAAYATQQQALVDQIEAGVAEYTAEHPELKADEVRGLYAKIGDSRQFPQLLAQYGGDGSAAIKAAMEIQYMTDPDLRRRLIDREIEQRKTDETTADETNDKWSQVAGESGATPTRPSTVDTDSEPGNIRDYIAQIISS